VCIEIFFKKAFYFQIKKTPTFIGIKVFVEVRRAIAAEKLVLTIKNLTIMLMRQNISQWGDISYSV